MNLYEPPRVRVADSTAPKPGGAVLIRALGIPWVICLGTLYFVTPVIAEGIALSVSGASVVGDTQAVTSALTITLAADLVLDALFVALATWWAIQLSRLSPFPVAILFALSLVAVRAIQSGGLPGVIYTGFPPWYEWTGNANDLIGALLAAMLHFTSRAEESTT